MKNITYYEEKSADAGGEEDRLRGNEREAVGRGAEGVSRKKEK
jgi:hypothetical protein